MFGRFCKPAGSVDEPQKNTAFNASINLARAAPPMTLQYLLMTVFAVLLVGLVIPFSYGIRMAIFLALVVVSILTFLGGGMHYFLSLMHS
ncbi:MAG TPA: hypothetical protein VHY35_15100 [Stellaceae bacterium]|jgi:hypothetical protein|nr:hypothetical protein [Stellaceae bacterium]